MVWAWMAIRLTARSLASEPSRSTTRPVGSPKRGARLVSTATRSPSSACAVLPAGMASCLPSIFLSTGSSRPPPFGAFAENPQHAVLGMVDDLDDAAAVADAVVFLGFLDVQQHAVADAGGFAGLCLARGVNADFRRGPVRLFVPFVGRGEQFAVAIARGDVGEHGGGQGAGVVQLLAPLLDRAFGSQIAQHALELGAHGVLEPEGTGDFAGADFAGPLADEGENVSLGGEGGCSFGLFVQNRFSCACA